MSFARAHVSGCLLALAVMAASASCDAPPEEEGPPILLPNRDASSTDRDAPTCETERDPLNCGRCGNVCPGGPRGTPSCEAGRCVLSCAAGWGDCNGSPTDGCETNLTSTVTHCGACGHDCRACGGTTCDNGLCDARTLSTRPKDIELLAVDDSSVTYADEDGVSKIDKYDALVTSVYPVPSTPGLLVHGSIFFIYPGNESFSGIYRTNAGFVGPQFPSVAPGQNAQAMAVDETGLYYAVYKPSGGTRLLRCKDCSVPTELSATENSFRTNSIAVDSTTVFFGAGDMIRRVEKTSTDLKTLAIGQAPRALGVDATHVYWINEAPYVWGPEPGPPRGEVVRMPKDGGTPEKIITDLAQPLFLSVTDDYLYVTDRGNEANTGVVFRTAKDGRRRVELARGVPSLGGMAVDRTCVWFGASSEIHAIAR